MRFNVDRICELAGLGAASGGLISEAAVPAAKPAAAPAAKATAAPSKTAAPVKPAAKPAAPAAKMEDAEEEEEGMHYMDEVVADPDSPNSADDEDEGYHMEMGGYLDDDAMYEIDEMELAEALVTMRQQRLEESAVRDAVRDEIKRALSDKSGNWIYGSNKPTASRAGQIARGGYGVGFGFKR